MNPFDLPGPQFLLFYAGLCAVVLGGLVLVKRALESDEVPRLGAMDPYLIAYLRGGANEALRVATLSLLDRGLLTRTGDELRAEPDASLRVRRPLERKLLQVFSDQIQAKSLFVHGELCAELRSELQAKRLLVSKRQIPQRVVLALFGLSVLWGVASEKLYIAHARGKHNTGFLITFALVAQILVVLVCAKRRTALGDRVLLDLRVLFARLRDSAPGIQLGQTSNELALVAGVFGLSALSGAARGEAEALFPRATAESSSWGSSSSSSSCGASSCSSSSGGSSCSGGCGGGGGGGCGGCGGS